MKTLGPFLKAIYAGALAGLSALSAYLVNDTSLGQITAGQWVQVALAVLITGGGVYGLPNRGGTAGPSGSG